MNDHELLRQYVTRNSDQAFRELMTRHAGLVYSAAMRQVRDPHLAEEVTQVVFVLLARKASSLRQETILPAWLWQTARFTALRALRSEQRRELYEREAAAMKPAESNSDESWAKISPLIDETVGRLSERDRAAMLLRFYETKSYGDIAGLLKISEAAAQKRVVRSIEKLRQLFRKKGFVITAAGLSAFLGSRIAEAIPEPIATALPLRVMARFGAGGSGASLELLAWRDLQLFRFKQAMALTGAVLATICILFALFQSSPVRSENPRQRHAGANRAPAAARAIVESGNNGIVFPRIKFHVIDAETKQPLSGVALVSFDFLEPSLERATEADGTFFVDLPNGRFPGMLVSVAVDGYRHRMRNFQPWEESQLGSDQIIEMFPSETFEGNIRDEAGEPIAGAQLVLEDFRLELGLRNAKGFRPSLVTAVSDSDGHWAVRQLPKNAEEIWLHVIHPDYRPTKVSFSLAHPVDQPVIILKPGIRVTGKVVNQVGEPVEASLEQTQLQGNIPYEAHTESNGTFAIEHAALESFRLRVEAPGYATLIAEIDPKLKPNLELKLQKSAVLRGRVLDEAGKGVPGATVASASDSFGVDDLMWRTKTDKNGRFLWDSAPNGTQHYGVVASGYFLRSGISLRADGSEHLLKIQKAKLRRFEGTVLDAANQNPIPVFEVLLNPNGRVIGRGTNGQFQIEFEDSGLEETFSLTIRAEGYPASSDESRPFSQSGRQFAFQLHGDSPFGGTVLSPGGQPAIGATLVLCDRGTLPSVQMREAGKFSFEEIEPELQTRTDLNGAFHFEGVQIATMLLISHPTGWAKLNLATCPDVIQLQAWGRIEGNLLIGKTLAREQALLLSEESFPCSYQSKTDATGNFVFEQVPPGAVLLYRCLNPNTEESSSMRLSHETSLQIVADQTTQVTLGGNGFTVTGRLKADPATTAINWTHDCYYLQPALDVTNPEVPPSLTLRYYFVCAGDGTFKIEDVPAGTYWLSVRVNATGPSGNRSLATCSRKVIIPSGDGSEEEKNSVNLGDVLVKIQPVRPTPEFE